MRIVGFLESSLLDWDGHVVPVIFLGGCNFACPFCHNSRVARDDSALPTIPWPALARKLSERPGWYDGVCVTGGEPVIHPELFGLLRDLKGLGLKVKLDTNGSFPYQLKDVIDRRLCDYVAMDIKTSLERYSAACGHPVESAVIRRSVRAIVESGIDYEFRCTAVPGLVTLADMPRVGELVKGARRFFFQQFIPREAASPALRDKKPYAASEIEEMVSVLSPFVQEIKLRGKFL
jgi:pyruvate formate lyase activating enzyme